MTEPLPQAVLLEAAEQKQNAAANPNVSAWVRANAGTGKTHVLVQRILRLLLAGANPRSILCLTFTKNAAAEMEARVLSKLAAWAAASDRSLKTALAIMLARAPSETELALARCLFATVIDAPGGLAIMTIHSFCERVLRRYSFEANVAPGFSVLTEEEASDALQEACAGAFAASARGPLCDALNCAVAYASEGEFARVLKAMLGQRLKVKSLLQVTASETPMVTAGEWLRETFNLRAGDTRATLIERAASVLDAHTLKEAVSALSAGSKSDGDGAERFGSVLRATGSEGIFEALKAAFMTKGGEPRKSLMTASVKKKGEALHGRLVAAQQKFAELEAKLCGLKAVEASTALLTLAEAIFERYETAKRARAALDFDDLIERTLSLLLRQEAAEWVLYELDARIDHILVDEAQDTSPQQWAILERLTEDFFAGQGARECMPTLFAVGDEKQSIYGFQGAVPEMLGHYGAHYELKAGEAGLPWCSADLDLSFRTLDPILGAVDDVSGALPDLQDGKPVRHLAYRREAGGLIELWEPARGEKQEKGSVWDAGSDSTPAAKPSQALADRIAKQIKHWLESGEGLASCGRPVEPGDILILLRKRAPMAKLIQAALKREGIPVAGTDRIALIDELAVMDLLALADALLQPEDDLALACVLKSPLLGLSEDDLFSLTYDRVCSLWQAVQGNPRYSDAARKLNAWRGLAGDCSPFDFFARILDAEGGRDAFAARLGAECFDALDEFLNLAENFSARPRASLAEFVSFARRSATEVKRETDGAAREVRIMTVHGAKGLEANIVILADTCGNRGASSAPVYFIGGGRGRPELPVWAVKGTGNLQPIADAKEEIKAAERRELGRLLYVAMTRARDRLYIAGFHNNSLPEGCWYETIETALAPRLREAEDFEGRTVWRIGSAERVRVSEEAAARVETMALPSWLTAAAPSETPLAILSPSKLMQWAGGDAGLSARLPEGDRETGRARGTLVHKLLEVLPALPEEHREAAAGLIARAFSGDLAAHQRAEAIATVLALLSSGVLSEGVQVLSEAGLAAVLQNAQGGQPATVLGQADRILMDGSAITVIDYKSGAPSTDGVIQCRYLAQLDCYRQALQGMYPEATIRAALLNTRTGEYIDATDGALRSKIQLR